MTEILIMPAAATDADRLTALIHDCSAYRGAYAQMIAEYRVTPEYLARHEVHLAVRAADGDLLGFYALITEPAELDLMFVADRAQGLGVGRRLIAHLLDRARALGLGGGIRVVSHPPAEAFYLRMGAERVGTFPARPPIGWDRPELRFAL
ncbi:GNAT family N-acetyltransferase [Streptomyces sp. NRRL S-495]|uniref:GNAT family N-acetyltransferase n=1 Tax=Streptomyces sp. NRRL S-495 TaxID=1609133 RepID=UPI00257042ED|nr:GNAT family N-acetyltransferase [Streptomyces sp. NRRL S-495]